MTSTRDRFLLHKVPLHVELHAPSDLQVSEGVQDGVHLVLPGALVQLFSSREEGNQGLLDLVVPFVQVFRDERLQPGLVLPELDVVFEVLFEGSGGVGLFVFLLFFDFPVLSLEEGLDLFSFLPGFGLVEVVSEPGVGEPGRAEGLQFEAPEADLGSGVKTRSRMYKIVVVKRLYSALWSSARSL